jgi:hypothetical protein
MTDLQDDAVIRPQRIQLSRAKGFRLQQVSMALNGLPAVKVDRMPIRFSPMTTTGRGA